MAGVHFTGPILFAGKNNDKKWFENLPIDKNPDYVVYFDDFDRIGFDSNTGHRWTVVKDSGVCSNCSRSTEWFSKLKSQQQQQIMMVLQFKMKSFKCNQTKIFGLKPKVRTSDVTDTDLCFGLLLICNNSRSYAYSNGQNCVSKRRWRCINSCKTEKDGTETSTDSGIDMENDTDVTLSIRCQSTGKVDFFVNRKLVATHTDNIPSDEILTIAAMSLSGNATGTKVTSIDYMFAASDR